MQHLIVSTHFANPHSHSHFFETTVHQYERRLETSTTILQQVANSSKRNEGDGISSITSTVFDWLSTQVGSQLCTAERRSQLIISYPAWAVSTVATSHQIWPMTESSCEYSLSFRRVFTVIRSGFEVDLSRNVANSQRFRATVWLREFSSRFHSDSLRDLSWVMSLL